MSRNKNTGIRTKLLYSFLLVIAVMIALNMFFIWEHINIVDEYDRMTNTLVLESKFTQTVPDFIESYHNLINVGGKSEQRLADYMAKRQGINSTMQYLDGAIVNKKSRVAYNGLKNVIQSIIDGCDRGIDEMKQGDSVSAYGFYDTANDQKTFITEDSGQLMLEELKYTEELHKNIDDANNTLLIIGFVTFFVVLVSCISYGFIFSKKMSEPLVKLSNLSTTIAEGNLEKSVDKDITARNDEFGSLARSFDVMVKNLRDKIQELGESRKGLLAANEEAVKVKNELEIKNNELERFNKLAVGRELKMIDLKKRVRELEEKSEKSGKKAR